MIESFPNICFLTFSLQFKMLLKSKLLSLSLLQYLLYSEERTLLVHCHQGASKSYAGQQILRASPLYFDGFVSEATTLLTCYSTSVSLPQLALNSFKGTGISKLTLAFLFYSSQSHYCIILYFSIFVVVSQYPMNYCFVFCRARPPEYSWSECSFMLPYKIQNSH